jgi:hypothetical protein
LGIWALGLGPEPVRFAGAGPEPVRFSAKKRTLPPIPNPYCFDCNWFCIDRNPTAINDDKIAAVTIGMGRAGMRELAAAAGSIGRITKDRARAKDDRPA